MVNLREVVEELDIIEEELGSLTESDENTDVLHCNSRDFADEDPRAIPFSDSDIDLLNSIENEKYGLGGGDYWRR